MYKSRYGSELRYSIISSITGKVALTTTPLERLVAMHIIFYENTEVEKHLKLRDYLNQFEGVIAILKARLLCASHLDSNFKGKSITKNVCSLYSQMLFLTPRLGHWKNGSWIQILNTAQSGSCSGFWVSRSQVLVPGTQFQGITFQGPVSQSPRSWF